jgi:hypothetical protein
MTLYKAELDSSRLLFGTAINTFLNTEQSQLIVILQEGGCTPLHLLNAEEL